MLKSFAPNFSYEKRLRGHAFIVPLNLNGCKKSFPKEDLRGCWICYSINNFLSNDTKISFLQIFSWCTLFFSYIYGTIDVPGNLITMGKKSSLCSAEMVFF